MQLLQVSAGDLQRFLNTPRELLGESEEVQIAIASFSETHRNLLEVLMESDYSAVVEVAKLHVNWVSEVGEDYREVISEILRDKDLGENDRLAVELMRFAPVAPEFLSEWVPVEWLIQGLKNEYMPLRYRLKLLERLSNQGELEAKLQVAESKETPVSILELLAGDLDLAVRLATEYNDNCPSEVVELVKTQYLEASNWDGDLEQLEELGESRWGWVRLAVAQNPYSSEDILMKLARDEEFQIRLAVAKNPGTSAEVLNVLMESGNSGIRDAIAEHPNATEGILLELFSTHRDLIYKRNDLPGSFLERFFRETFTEGTVPWKYKYSYLLLEQPNTPTWVLAELANVDLEALRADKLVTHSGVESETLEKWILDDIRYLKDIAKHPQVSEQILGRLANYPSPEAKVAVAQNDLTPEELKNELLEELAVHPEENIRLKLAKDINTPVHILEKIGQFEFYQTQILKRIRRIIAPNSMIRRGSIGSMSNSAMTSLKNNILFPAGISIDIESWMKIFETPQLIEASLNHLKFHGSDYKLYKVMNDLTTQWIEVLPNLPDDSVKEVVRRLIDIVELINIEINHFRSVPVAIVGNPSTPSSIRERLQKDFTKSPEKEKCHSPKENMLLALACNPQVPEAERMGYFQEIIDSGAGYFIAEDVRTPVHFLEQLFSSDKDYKKPIAKNPATPEYLLRKIGEECDEDLWTTLAENPNTPVDLLLSFLNEEPKYKFRCLQSISYTVIENPNSPVLTRYCLSLEKENFEYIAEVNEFMARRSDSLEDDIFKPLPKQTSLTLSSLPRIYNPNNDDLATVLTEYASSSNAFVRFVTLLHPVTPGEILTQGANSAFWLERYAIAENPETPSEVLEKLPGDGNWIIRAAANQNLSNQNRNLKIKNKK